jgi:flagellar biosynthetic protein FliR
MVISAVEATQWVGGLMWPFMRISAMLTLSPIFSQKAVPRRYRVLLGFALTMLIMPTLPPMPPTDIFSPTGILTAIWQVIIGSAMGFMVALALNTVIVAGEKLAMSMGLGFATMVDPQNGVNVPVIAQFFQILAILLFFALDAHLVLIELLSDSFHILPVGEHGLSLEAIWHIVAWGTQLFALALLMALPTMTAVLLVYLALGVMSRAAPQLNLFSVGFPITILGGLMLMWLL